MISFRIRAEGGTRVGDRAEVRRALALLISPGDRHELRALPGGACRIAEGDDLDAAADAAIELSDRQVYYSLNPIRPDADRANTKTVLRRVWFLVDVDPVRPRDVSSSDAEKAEAYQVVAKVAEFLLDLGWPAPLIVDSGNGWHLLYRVDLPNSKLAQQLLKAALAELARRFDTLAAVVDQKTHDAPRISKLPGTWAMKGPDTADRPHRMSRIHYEPDRLDVVEAHQITALATPAPDPATAPASSPPTGFATVASDGPGKAAYVRSAIERECYRVLIATERNNALNRAAFALGQFTSWPEMNEQQAKAMLKQAAERAGLDRDTGCGPAGILKTIASGWDAGKQQPRPRPVDPAVNGKAANGQAQAQKPMPAKLTVGLHEIVPKKVDWLWENIVAVGFISIFAGRTGVGKSFVTCDLVARLSRGEPPAFSTLKRDPCRTLFISEDPPEYMLGPRLLAMNAVQDRVRFMTWEAMASYQLGRLDVLEAAYVECGRPTLIVIDPPTNFLGKVDDHKNSELRGVLMGLVEWINRHGVAMIMITHLNKSGGKGLDAVSRVIGGTAWTTVGRVTIVFESDPDNPAQCLMGSGKINIGRKADTLAYTIESTTAGDTAVVKWIGPVDTTADDAVNKVKKKSRAQNAAEWLEDRFRERRVWPSDDLFDLARAEGISRNAIFEAGGPNGVLPLLREQITPADGGRRYWQWTARPGWPPEKTSGQCGTVGQCQANDGTGNDLRSVPNSESERDAADGAGLYSVPLSQSPSVPTGEEAGTEPTSRDVINRIFKPF